MLRTLITATAALAVFSAIVMASAGADASGSQSAAKKPGGASYVASQHKTHVAR